MGRSVTLSTRSAVLSLTTIQMLKAGYVPLTVQLDLMTTQKQCPTWLISYVKWQNETADFPTSFTKAKSVHPSLIGSGEITREHHRTTITHISLLRKVLTWIRGLFT
jgi:hypothetical protein